MTDIWYEDVLLPEDNAGAVVSKPIDSEEFSLPGSFAEQQTEALNGIVRVHQPRWRLLSAEETKGSAVQAGSRLVAVRLAFEFDLQDAAKRDGVRFVAAKCESWLWAASANHTQPAVYDIVPRQLNGTKPQMVKLQFEPQIKVTDVAEVSLGSISTDLAVGVIQPTCVGYLGRESREPYWTIDPQDEALLGLRTFWMVVEMPPGCEAIRVSARAQADARRHLGHVIPLRGRHTTRESLPSLLITPSG